MMKAQSDRLYFRELKEEDAKDMFELDSDPMVHQYLGNKPLTSINETEEVIQFVKKQYTENGIGRWAMIKKEDDAFLGWCGLKLIHEPMDGKDFHYDLGYRLIRKYWGQGYASEGALACLDYAFLEMKLPVLYASAHVENIASNKIIQKLGFTFKDQFKFEDELCNRYSKKNTIKS